MADPTDPRPDDAVPPAAGGGPTPAAVPPSGGSDPAPRSDAAGPRPGPAEPEEPVGPPPSEDELARVAAPARVRRAPRFKAFIWVGVLLGALLGLLAALVTGTSGGLVSDGTGFIGLLDGEGSVRFVSALVGALVGGLLGAGAALVADRRSVRHGAGDDPR